jgi:serine/threonine protein kinase
VSGKQLGNHFTLSSTREHLEFVHGDKGSNELKNMVHAHDFIVSTLLGTGGFGVVFKSIRKATGQEYALKVQPLECMPRTSRRDGKRMDDVTLVHIERTVLATCKKCPFIVNLEYAFHTDSYAVLALEYVAGEYFKVVLICFLHYSFVNEYWFFQKHLLFCLYSFSVHFFFQRWNFIRIDSC